MVQLSWPSEAERRRDLARESRPRLLLVDAGAAPPVPDDCLEDWVSVEAAPSELAARVAGLAARVEAHPHREPSVGAETTRGRVSLDAHGILTAGDGWLPLPPIEAQLLRTLLDRLGVVVSRDALRKAAWPEGAPRANSLEVRIMRLRRRIAPAGLAIRTVRKRGYMLAREPGTPQV